jgi:hypothetical protein
MDTRPSSVAPPGLAAVEAADVEIYRDASEIERLMYQQELGVLGASRTSRRGRDRDKL